MPGLAVALTVPALGTVNAVPCSTKKAKVPALIVLVAMLMCVLA
jgi:hypothetical protein